MSGDDAPSSLTQSHSPDVIPPPSPPAAAATTTQLLAPTDDAFASLGLNTSTITGANRTALELVLRYHIVEGLVDAENIETASPLTTIAATQMTVSGEGVLGDSQGRSADILATDLVSSNGIMHAISSVMLPFSLSYLLGSDDSPSNEDGGIGDRPVEIAALTAGLAAAVILIAAAIAVQKRRQADAARPPQVAPDDEGGWVTAGRPAAVHPA